MKNLTHIKPEIKRIIEPYTKQLLAIHKENIISIILYGSAASGTYRPGHSDINLIVILEQLGLKQLKSSLRLVSHGIKKKITAPLFLSLQHIETSKDVFPIEFLEIKENHILLYGKDPFKDMHIDNTHIRLFCERELKGKLIRLREAYLEIGLKKKGIEALIKNSLKALLPIFRTLMRLKGISPSTNNVETVAQLSELFGLDEDVFLAILKDRCNDEQILGKDIDIYFERYLNEIEKLALAVDNL